MQEARLKITYIHNKNKIVNNYVVSVIFLCRQEDQKKLVPTKPVSAAIRKIAPRHASYCRGDCICQAGDDRVNSIPAIHHRPFALNLSRQNESCAARGPRSWFDRLTTNGGAFFSEKGYRKKLHALEHFKVEIASLRLQ